MQVNQIETSVKQQKPSLDAFCCDSEAYSKENLQYWRKVSYFSPPTFPKVFSLTVMEVVFPVVR